jgi:hypothetical protein
MKEVIDPRLLKNINKIKYARYRKFVLVSTTETITEYIEGNNYPEFSFKFALDTIPLHYQFVRVHLRQIPHDDEDESFINNVAKASAFPDSFKFFPNSSFLTGSFVVRGQKGTFMLSIFGDGTEDYEPIQVKLVINDKYDNQPLVRAENLFKYKMVTPDRDIIKRDMSYLHTQKVFVIQNVYQEIYKGGLKPTGFGDFIRGCYFILQFCKKHKFKSNIIINHPIALCLKQYENFYINKNKDINLEMNKIFDNIHKFEGSNFISCLMDNHGYIIGEKINDNTIHDFIDYLGGGYLSNHTLFIYNILFPYYAIEEKDKLYIRYLLEPNEEMNIFIDETIAKLGVIKKKYTVIHIRCGDEYLCDNSSVFTKKYLIAIFDEIKRIVSRDSETEYLLISDNNLIKGLIKKFLFQIKNVKMLYNSITHVGETNILDIEKVKNTMLDFYLLANSGAIYSISVYAHGSGFSYWCAKTYNIPYKCKFIE